MRKCTEALQQATPRRHGRATVLHFSNRLVGCPYGGSKARLRKFDDLGIGHELLAHQEPAITSLGRRRRCIPLREYTGAASSFDLADASVHHCAQFGQCVTQGPWRHRFTLAPQSANQALAG